MLRTLLTVLTALIILADARHALAAERNPSTTDWPQWRGPRADNVADGRNLPVKWSQTENVRWTVIHAIRLRGDGQEPEPLWTSEKPGPVEPSLLYYRGLVYALMDNGVLTCLDGKTGEEQYRKRLGGDCNSSPLASDGKIYLSNNDGKTFVVRAGTQFELLATNDLGERITATLAITGGELLYRTDSHLYLIGSP
jgi:outer membrane protein assembly factor BamB